jgi:hypothetical protein
MVRFRYKTGCDDSSLCKQSTVVFYRTVTLSDVKALISEKHQFWLKNHWLSLSCVHVYVMPKRQVLNKGHQCFQLATASYITNPFPFITYQLPFWSKNC